MNKDNSIIIFSGSDWQANMVKSMLEAADIRAFIKDGFMGTIAPWYVGGGGAGAVKVIILKKDIEKAKSIIQEYEQNSSEG